MRMKKKMRTQMRYSGYGEEKGVFYIGFLGHLERGGEGEGGNNGRK